jgi:hypothetical protein
MKKLILLFVILLSLTINAENSFDKTVNKTGNGVGKIYTDSKSAISTVYSDLKSTAPQIAKGVNEMAKGLKVGAESVWKVLVKQQLVWSIAFLILTLASIINWCIFYKRNFIKLKPHKAIVGKRNKIINIPNPDFDQEYYDQYKKYLGSTYSSEREYTEKIQFKKVIQKSVQEDYLMSPVEEGSDTSLFKYIHFIVCIALSGLSFYHFSDMLTGFINPEFGAMKNIVELTLSLKK